MARIPAITNEQTLKRIENFLAEVCAIREVIQEGRFFITYRRGELVRQPEWLALRNFVEVLDARRLNRKNVSPVYSVFVFDCIDWALRLFPDWRKDMRSFVRHLKYLLNRKSEGAYRNQSDLEFFFTRLRNNLRKRVTYMRSRQRIKNEALKTRSK